MTNSRLCLAPRDTVTHVRIAGAALSAHALGVRTRQQSPIVAVAHTGMLIILQSRYAVCLCFV